MLPPLHRSPAPDLLFEDVRERRLRDIVSFLHAPDAITEATPLHRLTVFVTYACNLRCEYCKTIHLGSHGRGTTFTRDSFARMMEGLGDTPIRHVHFTGGEAGLAPELPDMMRCAKRRGAAYLSVTTNGTLPERVYRELVASGLDEVRVSVDAGDPETGRLLTGRIHAWRRSIHALTLLADMRDAGAPLFVIANTVVNERNRRDIDRIARFLLDIGINDMKLITVVQGKDHLGDFPEAAEITRRLHAILTGYPSSALPLLRRKLTTIFDPVAIGLRRVSPTPRWRCYIPLTERTVDGRHYYPCPVYLREGGEPIGSVEEDPKLQRCKTALFVERADCLDDPICREFCLHCTRLFNVAANEAAWKIPS